MQKALPDTTVYIVQAKLDVGAISELFELAEHHTKGACRNAMDADVIITAIAMRRRLERHVPWDIAVSPSNRLLYVRLSLYESVRGSTQKTHCV